VGNHGSLAFLERRYGPGSRTVAEARDELADQALYNDFLEGVTRELRAVYAAPVSRAEKLRRHDDVLARAREREASLPFRSTRGHRLRRRTLNNAVIATYAVYFGAQEPFEAVYRRLGCDLARFVRFVHDRVAHERDPEGFMLAWARGEVR
jgi:predicted aminopeptidase